jgi:putative tricarboxylic transport membrane protein
MRKSDRILGWVLLGLALLALGEGWRTWDKIGGTGFMPVIIGIIFSLLGFGLLFNRRASEEDQPLFGTEQAGWRRVALACIIFALFVLTIPFVGYVIGTIVFLTILFKIMGVVRWRTGFIFGVVGSISTYVIFKILLSMPLPDGFLGH